MVQSKAAAHFRKRFDLAKSNGFVMPLIVLEHRKTNVRAMLKISDSRVAAKIPRKLKKRMLHGTGLTWFRVCLNTFLRTVEDFLDKRLDKLHAKAIDSMLQQEDDHLLNFMKAAAFAVSDQEPIEVRGHTVVEPVAYIMCQIP
jgi:hypothetical protein